MRDSGGTVDIVTDEEILEAQYWLARSEGIFVEPASAASIAGLMKCAGKERCATCPLPRIPEGARIVCTVTGHGLKDPDVAKDRISGIVTASADKAAILDIITK
jgi:threonine synthase